MSDNIQLKFGSAIELMRKGKCVSRKSWNNEEIYIGILQRSFNNVYAFDFNNGLIKSTLCGGANPYTIKCEDIFAEDWFQVDVYDDEFSDVFDNIKFN
jgi:hypothetical protein